MNSKHITTALAALTAGLTLTGCSHDFGDYDSPSQSITENYNRIFVQNFGQPAADQTWGFDTPATSRMTRAARKAMPEKPTFRDALASAITKPATPTFSTTVPAGTTYAQTIGQNDWQDGQTVYIDANYASVDQNKSNLVIYATGTLTFNGYVSQNGNGTTIIVTENSNLTLQNVVNNLKVYLAPGATLTLGDATFQNSHAELYLSSGSQVKAGKLQFTNSTTVLNAGGTITATSLKLDQGNTLWNEGTITLTEALTCYNTDDKLYNAGGKTITAGSIDLINNNALLYNDGTVKSNGEIKMHNSLAELVNNGTLSGTVLNMSAGGKMHNVGTTNISGKTDLTNSNSQWMNDGQYTSGSFDVDNYSKQNYNNCRLTVLGDFHLNRGEFVIDANASVVTNTFTWEDTSNFYLGSKSMLSVAGRLLTKNANSNYGFRAYGDDYAVIQAQEITHEGNEQFRMSYYGKLYVATSSHFGQWYKDAPNTQQPAYYYESSVKFAFTDADDANVVASTSPVSIPASACSPGYSGNNNGGGDNGGSGDIDDGDNDDNDTWGEWKRIICEDLTVSQKSDFDFNDVVFDARINTAGTKAQIKLKAAGGTLPLTVGWSGEEGTSYNAFEVHNMYDVAVNVMVNTHATNGVDGKADVVKTLTGSFSNYNDIKIMVQKLGVWTEITAHQGEPASKIAVGTDYEWCDERQDISKKYSNFTNYVQDATLTEWWRAEPVSQ